MEFKPILRFAVVSDTHYNKRYPYVRERFNNVVKFMYDYADAQEYSKIDALYVVGDFVDTTLREQYEMFAADCHALLRDDTVLRVTQANHDLHYLPEPLNYHDAEDYFRELLDIPFHDHLVINGYHFISISGTYDGVKWHDAYTKEVQAFVKASLDEAVADDPKKPIFTFRHLGYTKTNRGGRLWGTPVMREMMNDYPQVINFSGHSHCPLNDPEAIDQTDFTTVDTGCFLDIDAMRDYAHCLLVEVDANSAVRIRPIDAVNCVFFDTEWTVEEAWDKSKFKYTKARADAAPTPYFEGGTKIEVEATDDGLTLTIPQAKCDGERVREYLVQLVDAEDNELTKVKVSSGFPGLTMPESVKCTVKELPEVPYRIKVTAIAVWEKMSAPLYVDLEK